MNKPLPGEYNPYLDKYIGLVPDNGKPYLQHLDENTQTTSSFFYAIPENKHNYRYADGKWTVKEVLMHMIDTERVFAYRALVCLRGDATTPLYYMEEDLYAANVSVGHRNMSSLIEEFETVRRNSHFLFNNMTEEQGKFLGNNMEHKISARAVAYVLIGHITHHLQVLSERYLQDYRL